MPPRHIRTPSTRQFNGPRARPDSILGSDHGGLSQPLIHLPASHPWDSDLPSSGMTGTRLKPKPCSRPRGPRPQKHPLSLRIPNTIHDIGFDPLAIQDTGSFITSSPRSNSNSSVRSSFSSYLYQRVYSQELNESDCDGTMTSEIDWEAVYDAVLSATPCQLPDTPYPTIPKSTKHNRLA